MRKKINDFLSESSLNRLSYRQKREVWDAIKNNTPIVFTGDSKTGKTTLARELQKNGVAAYGPEMVCFIELKPRT